MLLPSKFLYFFTAYIQAQGQNPPETREANTATSADVIVIGAGLAGLGAARGKERQSKTNQQLFTNLENPLLSSKPKTILAVESSLLKSLIRLLMLEQCG